MSELFRRGFPHHGITKTELSVAAYVFAGLTVLAFSRIAWLSRQEGMAWSSIAVTPALIAGAATTHLLLNGWLGWTLFSIILFFTVSTWTVGWTEAIPSRFSYVSKVYIKPEGFDLALRNADYVHVPWSATRSISTEGKFISWS